MKISNTSLTAYYIALIYPKSGVEREFGGVEDYKSYTPLPDFITIYNGGTMCDTAVGPCSCGATHYFGEERK